MVCSRKNKFPGYIETEIVLFQFNKDATIKNYKEIYEITYENIEDLKEYKKYLDSINKKYRYDEVKKV